ncbi:hypothetical protein [Lysobacter sp. CFH 32150]|uniref:hypothetical protein n=1 Tax=Lysobacter sp. CFH 32150 TaxID=2927128 RepID=UPI001FA74006|nr:hypothetical protein [Lysobacter sp. CFH 32150]MCI4566931.1 hypothetical protein [Lysobacter sp. CFH 32150]
MAAGLACGIPLYALAATYAWEEGYKQVIPSSNIEALSPDGMFGEQIGLYTGSLSFLSPTVDLRGNNDLKVSFGLAFSFDNPKVPSTWLPAVPHLEGVYPRDVVWKRMNQISGIEVGRCSAGKAAPPWASGGQVGSMSNVTSTWDATEYWNGDFLVLPGAGSQEILKAQSTGVKLPTDGKTYVWVTQQGWRFTCLPTAKNDPGEGFVGVSPDGMRYHFDWFAVRDEGGIDRPVGAGPAPKKGGKKGQVTPTVSARKVDYLLRDRVYIYPTLVEDRFGNSVTYTYDALGVKSITASDGRSISVTRVNDTTTVTAAGKTWTYTSSTVTLPDGSRWVYDFSHLSSLLNYSSDGGVASTSQCDTLPPATHGNAAPYYGTVTHPSGATATFTIAPTRHGRSYIPRNCIGGAVEGGYFYYAYRPYLFDTVSLVRREVTGPGLPTMTWQYSYGPPNNSWEANCTSGCVATKYVDVRDPDGTRTRHTFSNRWQLAEGKELLTETFDVNNVLRKKVEYAYQTDPTGQPYPAQIGVEGYTRGDQAATKFDPLLITKITQDGRTFTNQVNAYDDLARPTNVTKSSAPAP